MAFRNQKRRWHCLPGVPPTEMDKTIMYWENKGKEVPTRDLIKTPEQIEGIRRAGVVNTGVLDAVAAAIHKGMNTLEIDQICRKYCEEHHAIPVVILIIADPDTQPHLAQTGHLIRIQIMDNAGDTLQDPPEVSGR